MLFYGSFSCGRFRITNKEQGMSKCFSFEIIEQGTRDFEQGSINSMEGAGPHPEEAHHQGHPVAEVHEHPDPGRPSFLRPL